MERLIMKVKGRVQGVGFRYFARQIATKLGLTGYVRNCEDGSVEIVAEGDSQALHCLLRQVRSGPGFATVIEVDTEWGKARGAFSDFRILS